MVNSRRFGLAPYVRPVCLLLCLSLGAPSAALSAALNTPRQSVVSRAGDGPKDVVSGPAREGQGAGAGLGLSATFTEARPVTAPESSPARRKVNARSRLAATPPVVRRVVKPVAAASGKSGGEGLAGIEKLTDGVGYGSFFKGGAPAPPAPVFSATAAPKVEVVPDAAPKALPETAAATATATAAPKEEAPAAKADAAKVDEVAAVSGVTSAEKEVVKKSAATREVVPSVVAEEMTAPGEVAALNSKTEAVVSDARTLAGETAAEESAGEAGAGTLAAVAAATAVAVYAPANDNRAYAQVVSALQGTASGNNIGATKEAGEAYHALNRGGASVWYRWTAPAKRTMEFSTQGSGFDTLLAVYKSTSAGLVEVHSNDDISTTVSASRATFDAVTGTVYFIAVDGYHNGTSAAQGSIVLKWNTTNAPANNNFIAAQALSATTTGTVTGTNRGASLEAYEPYHANDDGGKSVWYKWTAPSAGVIEFTTAGSNFDTLLAVYTGTAVNALTRVAENDEEDFNAGVHSSRLVFSAAAGATYYIAVDGYDGNAGGGADWGNITLQWKAGPAVPANNSFAAAQAITGDEGRIKGGNWLATKETGEPNHAQTPGGKSVWYKFQAPGTGQVSFDTLGSSIDTVMAVYTGTSVGALTLVTSNDDADQSASIWTSRVNFNAAAGTTYYIAIDGWNGEAGTIVLRTPRRAGRVAFVSNRDGDDEIYTADADGSDLKQLTANASTDTRPDWSPDGTRLVFESNRDGNSEIYVMNADGTGQTRLTANTSNDSQPVFSPDGTKIAFTSDRVADGGGYELYVMNADGTNPVRLTYQVGTDSRPEWSPDGGKLIFASNYFGNTEIHILSAVTGRDQWRLTRMPASTETNPDISPDGTRYVFQSNRNGNNEVYVVNPNATLVNLTNNPASDEAPDYSPDGETLLFATTRDGNAEVYAMNANGTDAANATFNLSADNLPDWQSVTATPNTPPTVTLTSPADGTKYAAPASITINATASDVGGSITKVAFYNGTNLLFTDTAAPYSYAWTAVPAGTYSLTAIATDNRGATTKSDAVRVTVNPALAVSIASPTAGTTFDTGSKVTINAEAAANTTTISKVEFYYAAAATPATTTLIGSDTAAPYSIQWDTTVSSAMISSGVPAGSYVLTAKVTDSALATATSAAVSVSLKTPTTAPPAATCAKTVTANVVAFDQVYTYNRFGAFNPAGMMYALRRDVVPISGTTISPGNIQLRPDKRPRPIVLRVNEGDCLQVTFTNYLTATRAEVSNKNFTNQPNKQTYTNAPVKLQANDSTFTRAASMHVNGLDYVNGPSTDDGANVGNNTSSLAGSGQTKTYKWYARKQGQYMIHSMGANVGGEGDGGQVVLGLFGAVVVEPQGAKWYRSQVTSAVLNSVTTGRNPDGTPKINFEATDAGGTPILNMLQGSEIVHTDVNALITGFQENCTNAPPSSTCGQPFREFVVVFHDETKTVQAFPELDEELFHGVRDGFAINYGSGSLGAPLVANRKRLGPAKDCGECKFEEFFLESWANGDPAMVVRKDSYGRVNEVLFPDDPSGVHHSYLGDPVRFRNVHVGPKETHVFHLHAHQWLHEPREDDSTYLDSQTIGVGSGFTYEINYGGSGNRNFTAGDSIFHCHLYPHFAQGMWELWRVHDVFEQGTADRNLPDGEIAGGTPTPAVVPLPNRAMAPMPTDTFKGFPFFVPAQAGHRPPQPPLDMEQSGGLPRHRIVEAEVIDGQAAIQPQLLQDPVAARVLSLNNDPNLLAFARELEAANVELIDPNGTKAEQKAMQFHEGVGGVNVTSQYGWPAKAFPSFTPTGAQGLFLVNGQPRQPGAPFAEPCAPNTPMRNYRAAYIQFPLTVNRAGWHDRQARITVLEDDALATRDGLKQAEPFFFRANSNDCIKFAATNLIPHVLNLDDFQIFTPTDTIGQHIHLVKFDVTSSDGAGNGWNYEDGTFSPGEVQERVKANNAWQAAHGGTQMLSLVTNPKFGSGPDHDGNGIGDYVGAQTTVQRWWADPLLNNGGQDRTIRTVFTHDHFGPSSHQHHGLYGALVVEPQGSTWETVSGTPMGNRADGGPTSFAANIISSSKTYREFNLALADFAIVYTRDLKPINPPGRNELGLPFLLEPPAVPQPESISADDPGTALVNYRNEPIPLRIRNEATNQQFPATDPRGDMANVFRSKDDAGATIHGDPFTPLLEAYEGDTVQIRLIQGAQEEQHVFSLHGGKWLHEPSAKNSGWYNAQGLGISEHFEFEVPPLPAVGNVNGANKDVADFLYGALATDQLWNGQWGILRSYRGLRGGLKALPNNSGGVVSSSDNGLRSDFCPAGATQRPYTVEAWLAKDLVGVNGITYNSDYGLKDPAGIVFVRDVDVAAVKAGTKKLEPLVLRANAGDCVNVTLFNKLPVGATPPDYAAWNLMPMLTPGFNLNQIRPSNEVSLHPQLLEYDVRTSDGANVGLNDKQTVAPGASRKYRWYAGKVTVTNGVRTAQPIEYGTINLTDYGDIMKHGSHGAGGVLVVEPAGSTWTTPANTNAEAEVKNANGTLLFKEFVLVYQDDVKMVGPNAAQGQTILGLAGVNPVRNYVGESDAEDSGMKAFNYRTEPLWARLGFTQEMTKRDRSTFQDVTVLMNNVNQANVFSSATYGDPQTPVFSAAAGTPVRFRVAQPTGHARQHAFTIYGHNWFHEPWTNDSTVIWSPGVAEPTSTTIGTQGGHSARRHWNMVLRRAGGHFSQPGDYMFRTQESFQVTNGLWGIFRVTGTTTTTTTTQTTPTEPTNGGGGGTMIP